MSSPIHTDTYPRTNDEGKKLLQETFWRIQFEGDLCFTQLVSYMIFICSFAKLDFVSKNKWPKAAGKTMKNENTISRMSELGL